MKILEYNHLDYSAVKVQYEKVIAMIQNDDFYSADVKKLAPTSYYRAKLDYSNRLLFKIAAYQNQKYALMLEIIHHHAYDKSKFLNGALIDESKISASTYSANDKTDSIIYINENVSSFNILDKIISFDDVQHEIFKLPLPIIIIGSAGSGKTVLTLEKMKECYGDILYITHSPFLVENSRNLYYAMQYRNEDQNLDFLSYRELLETVKVPEGKEINPKLFSIWLKKQSRTKLFLVLSFIKNIYPARNTSTLASNSLFSNRMNEILSMIYLNNSGRTALQILLLRSYLNAKFAQTKLALVYPLLAPSSISIKVEDKLIKIDNHLMEFFLFNLIAALSQHKFSYKYFHYRPGFGTADFLEPFEHFPENVLLTRRKKRSYITSILAKNEINRNDPYNRKLFIRTHYGRYLINPKLEVKINEDWVPIYNLLGLDISTIVKNQSTEMFQDKKGGIDE